MSLEQKQEYLRQEIVEKKYDPEKFYEFWQTFSIDLNDATMDDIYSVVHEFHKNQSQKYHDDDDEFGQYVGPDNHDSYFYQDINWDFLAEKKVEKKDTALENTARSEEKCGKIEKGGGELMEKSDCRNSYGRKQVLKAVENSDQLSYKQKNKDEAGKCGDTILISADEPNLLNVTFQDVINDSKSVKRKCLKLQPNILQHHINVQINIIQCKEVIEENPSIINKIWKGTYLLFTIKTIARNKKKSIGIAWQVQRQQSDFQWLRNTLTKTYPGLVVPSLPTYTKMQAQLNGYQRKLESFLLDCYNCPQLRNSKYFEVFLSYSSHKDFESFKKSCESVSKPKNLSHILNMTGEIQLLYSDKIDGYGQGLQNFLSKSSQHLKNVKNTIKQIDELYESISTRYKQLSETFIIMSNQSCQFSEEQCYPKLTETYKQIAQLVGQHSYFCILEKQFLETFMQAHFSYERDRINNMQTLISKRKIFVMEFAKPKHQVEKGSSGGESGIPVKTSVFAKISNLFGEKGESIDVPSSDTTTLHDQVGFYNSQLMKESIRCIQGMISSHVNHFSMYGHSRIDNVESMQKLWSKILVQLSKLQSH